ncbi:MAG: hypothetical protein AB1645_10170, partial [Bacillota bacterium]
MPEGKIRVDELAEILGIEPGRLMILLGDLGVKVPNPAALVDASLENRLKGIVRRPSYGGRGQMAARPEPVWLTSLQRPRPKKPPGETAETEALAPGAKAAAAPGGAKRPPAAAAEAGTAPGAADEEAPARAEKPTAGAAEAAREAGPEQAPVRAQERGPGRVLPSGRNP